MSNNVQHQLDSLLAQCRQYFATQKLSHTSRKLYLADIRRFLNYLSARDLVLSSGILTKSRCYLEFVESLQKSAVSPVTVRRMNAALKNLAAVVSQVYGTPNPLTATSRAVSESSIEDYIKHFTNYLKSCSLSPLTIRSYKSDIKQYSQWATSHTVSKEIDTLLTPKMIEKYADHLTNDQKSSLSTIERKSASLTRFRDWFHTAYPTPQITDNVKKAMSAHTLPIIPEVIAPVNAAPQMSVKRSLITAWPRLYTLSSLVSFTLLIALLSGLAFFGYRQFARDRVLLTQAYPSSPITPNRQLSFQGRLETSGGTPITSATNFVFKLFDAASSGTQLYTTGTCSITPDSDGIFSTQIGSTCGSAITSSVFTENANVYLEVTVGAETLNPRQQIATVAYALNSETLQGYPISATVSAIKNTVVPMNQYGEIIVGEQSPRLRGVAGTFQISAPSLSLVTATGTNGNISIAPDGTGQVNLTGNTTTTNFFNVSNAQLTSGSLITGTAANNNSGFKLLDLLSGSSPTSKFAVGADGTLTTAGNIGLSTTGAYIGYPGSSAQSYIPYNANFDSIINSTKDVFINMDSDNNDADTSVFTVGKNRSSDTGGTNLFTVNENGNVSIAGDLTITGDDLFMTTNTAGHILIADGTNYNPTAVSGDITLSGAGVTAIGADKILESMLKSVNGPTDELCLSYESGGGGDFEWQACGSGGNSNWRYNLGTISPINDTVDLLVGANATASAKFAVLNVNSGTPTASVSAGTSGSTFITANGHMSTTQRQSLTLGNSSTYNTTGDILLNPNGTGMIGVGTTTPTAQLDVNGNASMSGNVVFRGPGPNYIRTLDGSDFRFSTSVGGYAGNTDRLTIMNNGNVGIGTTSTTQKLHVASGTAGSDTNVTFGTSDSSRGILTLSGNTTGSTAGGYLLLNTAADHDTTYNYYHVNVLSDDLTIGREGFNDITINDTGLISFLGDVTVNGNTTLGDAITDSLTFTGRVAQESDLIPITATGTSDLGSSALPWDNLYLTTLNFSGAASLGIPDNTTAAFRIAEGANVYMDITTLNDAETFTLNLPVGGATSHTANLFNANIAQTINIGTGTAVDTINIGTGGTNSDDINIGGLATSHTDFTGILNFAGGTTYFVDASGNAKFLDIIAADTANPGLTVGNGSIGFARFGGSTLSDNNSDLTLDSDTVKTVIAEDLQINGDDILDSGAATRVSLGATTTLTNTTTTLSGTTTLTASNLATLTTSSSVNWGGATSITLTADNATINGSDVADGDITIQGTSNASRNTSFVILQPNGGFVGIRKGTPTEALDVSGNATVSGNIAMGGQLQVGQFDSTPVAVGAGAVYFDTNSPTAAGDLYFYGSDSAWHALTYGLTKFTANNTTVANGSYIEIAHNTGTNDMTLTGWFKDTVSNLYKNITEYSHNIVHNLQNQWSDASYTAFNIDTGTTLRDNLYGYWKLDEATPSANVAQTRVDSYSSNHLTDNRTITSYTYSDAGKVGNAADFELSNGNFLEIADNAALSTGDIDFSLSAWVKLESKATSLTIVSKFESTTVREYAVFYAVSNDRLSFRTYDSGGNIVCTADANSLGSPATGTWYHIVVWHDSIGNTCNIKVNNGATTSVAETGVPADTASNFRIGAVETAENTNMDGMIDEVGFWKKILSATEITDLYNSGNGNTYGAHSGFVRTQANQTNLQLREAINTGTGADGAVTISSNTNINVVNNIAGRTCADGGDAVAYSVTVLTSTTATLDSTPSTGCLKAGDEVLIINLRGTSTAIGNVGNYETLRVANIAGTVVTFTTSKTNYYGDGPTDDTNIGTGAGNQQVALQRVPNYTNLTVNSSQNLTATGFTGNRGGVIFFRASGTVSVAGTINTNSAGYRGGSASFGGVVAGGNGGESFCGIGGAGSTGGGGSGAGGGGAGAGNGGAGLCGGGGAAAGVGGGGGAGSVSRGGAGGGGGGGGGAAGGGGYGTAGGGGTANNSGGAGGTNTSGNGGASGSGVSGGGGGGGTYGTDVTNLSKLYFGSGGGQGGKQAAGTPGSGGAAGGIIFIAAQTISVSGGIQSIGGGGGTGTSAGGGGGAAGGSIRLEGQNLTLGSNLVNATGGSGGIGANSWFAGNGGSGRIAIYYANSVSGSTTPVATNTLSGYHTYGLYHSPAIKTPNAATLESIRWDVPTSTPSGLTNVHFQTRTGATSNPTDGTWEEWKPESNLPSGCNAPNCLTLSSSNTNTEWSGTAASLDGDVTRNIDMFEDEDETSAGNLTKMSVSGFSNDTVGTLNTNLSAFWPLNEASGTRSDTVGVESLTANGTGGVGAAAGRISNAADIELSESDFLEKTDDTVLSTGDIDFSVGAWVNLESESAGTTQETIISKHESATVREYSLYYTGNTTDRFRFELFNSGGTSVCTVTDTTAVTTATWYYVIAWHDAAANTCNIQVNNNTATSAAETGVPADTAANVRIGAINTTESSFFDGLVDEAGFWKKALSANERTSLYNSGNASTYPANGQYLEDTIGSTDLTNYDFLTFWVRSSVAGSTIKFGFGESAGTENEHIFLIDAANTWQKVYFDLSDVQSAARNAVTKVRLTNLASIPATLYVDNVQAENHLTDNAGSAITSTPNTYFQYRIIFTTTNTAYYPSVENIQLVYTDGFKIVQTDTNTVRLYNYTGSTQDLRLDAITMGADLAEWYSVNDDSIGPGEVVALSGQLDEFGVPILRRAEGVNDPGLIGAISTKAGQTLGLEKENRRLLALTGRIPVKMDLASEPLETGDPLTSGSVPGTARRARPGELSFARATGPWTPEDGASLLVIVNNTTPASGFGPVETAFTYVENTWTLISTSTGAVLTNIGSFAKLVAAEIEIGNLAVDMISPLASGSAITATAPVIIKPHTPSDEPALVVEGEIDAASLSARVAKLEEVHADRIYAKEIVADKISADVIEGLDAKIATLTAGTNATLTDSDVETLTTRIKDRIALLTGSVPTASDLPSPQEATNSAQVIVADATPADPLTAHDFDFVTINSYLAVVGEATITTLTVTDSLTVATIQSPTATLSLQPLGGRLNLVANTLIVDSTGEVAINGNLTVAGTVLAQSASLNSISLGSPSGATPSALGRLMAIYNEQGQEVATIDASGSANLAGVSTHLITIAAAGDSTPSGELTTDGTSNATAGVALLPASKTELTINSKFITADSLVYLTPTTNTDNKVLFVKSKTSCDTLSPRQPDSSCQGAFTVAIDSPARSDISFNWWIIRLKQ